MVKDYDILCVGLINVNLLAKPVDKSVFDVDVTLLDGIDVLPGGDALNEAVVLSRLGNKVGLIGKVGRDDFAETVLNSLKKEDVDTNNIKIDENVKTSACIVLINKDGSRNFATYRGANSQFSITDIDLSILKRTQVVNVGSMFALKKLDGAGVEILFKEARANHVVTAADMKQDTYKLGFEGIKNVLKYTDYFLPSYDEAAYLTKETDPVKMAEIFLNSGVKTVVIKLGEKGCYIKTTTENYLVEPFKTEAVDTTGAGDNFVAGFLTGVIKGWDLKKCGRFANAVGSVSVQKVGATTAVESMEQIMEYMENHNVI